LLTLVGILAVAIVFVLGDGADAKPTWLADRFEAAYPAAKGTRIDSCLICHSNLTSYSKNPFGKAYEEAENFPAIESDDSDGDGYSNIEEIQALTFPGDPTDNPGVATTTTTLAVPGTGAAIYQSNCAGCHGANGGNLVGRTITSAQIATAVNSGTTGMPGFSTKLSKAEIDAVVAYVAGKTSSATTTTAPGSPPPRGSSVFATNCATCHGASGGDLVGHSLSDAQLSSAVVDGKGGSMPAFGSRLDSAQITAVVAYLSSLRSGSSTPAGLVGGVDGTSLYVKYCSACHGPHGEGGTAGPLAGTTLARSELISIVTDGRGSMPRYSGRMNAEEIGAIADFILDSFESVAGESAGTLTEA
jgi:mono/diheme cytochrome c family protein